MTHIVLLEPEIPPNTGNVIRLAANTGCHLHLVEPFGFTLDDKRLRRAGLDYHEFSQVQTYQSWQDFLARGPQGRILALSTKGSQVYSTVRFETTDILLFGPETRGLPLAIRESLPPEQVLRIPMRANSRSLNLSNAVAIVVYEALRQLDFSMAQQ